MGRDIDDPGPDRNNFAVGDNQLFSGIREIVDQKDDGTMGIPSPVRESAGVRDIGMVLCRMGLLHPQPGLCVPQL